ncbi:putative membrane protein [Angulomicrobium tetraedrale]|uniref:Putative membrane protein n=1 Tax=Ancylobacter tetraedralis TaxID=217068 RepID=A0A839Z6N7_9HYPH|nr:NnrU family protein [Ancylobacter tetraedralis]MBB3770250.1 putative membrane protein [Ancylobacter tetraedralis]
MILMLAGLVLFLVTHVFTTRREARAAAVAQLGMIPYRAVYSIVSIAAVLMIAYGYGDWRAAGPAQLWNPPVAMRHIALTLMLLASIALGGYLVPSHIRAWLKHPMLVAVKIWALAHLIANGDAATMTLAVVILGWAVFDRISVKRRGSPLPVAPKGWVGDIVAVLAGLVLYAVLAFWFHPYIVGVPVMG